MTAPTTTKPVITTSRAVWRGEHRFEAGPEGRTVPVDADSKTAPGPVETLLNAIATCSGVDVLDILAKRRTPAERFMVNVTATRRSEAPPASSDSISSSTSMEPASKHSTRSGPSNCRLKSTARWPPRWHRTSPPRRPSYSMASAIHRSIGKSGPPKHPADRLARRREAPARSTGDSRKAVASNADRCLRALGKAHVGPASPLPAAREPSH